MQQLSLSARPRSLDGLVGQQKIIKAIRGHHASGRITKAWMFCGPKGSGKTSLGRILAASLQCTHQEIFGKPCQACYHDRAKYLHEINCADKTGIDPLRQALAGADYGLFADANCKVYLLDEVHMLSANAQTLALKYLEDSPETTYFILCSTNPSRIDETLQSRCIVYAMRDLEADDILKLVTRLLLRVKSKMPADRLADALIEQAITSPRLICMAAEKYLAGMSPEEAALVSGSAATDVRAITKALVKGDWAAVSRALALVQTSDILQIKLSIISYLRTILLESPEPATRTDAVAKAITNLCGLENRQDLIIAAGLASELYRLCVLFAKYRL
jgi:DNA polymerase-3 subunit gamma/tau